MALVDPLQLALVERQYVSQFSLALPGIKIYVAGALTDADAAVAVTMLNEASEEIYSGVANHLSDGTYDVTLSSAQTARPGLYLLVWEFEVAGGLRTEETYLEVGQRSPLYDSLTADFQGVVEAVYIKFADLFDSPLGGPHLQVYLQSNFGRERIAQLLRSGLGRLNVISQPHMTYVLAPPGKVFPLAQWGGLIEQVCYVEIIKHLRRSYVEQPDVMNVTVARFDRRDYMTRWGEILRDEQEELDKMIDIFKLANMGLGTPSVLVAGGVYGNWGPQRYVGLLAARPNYLPRYY